VLADCPEDCSGHGYCSSIREIAYYSGNDYDSTSLLAGDGIGITYTNWEANSTFICECDDGYFGPDCSLGVL